MYIHATQDSGKAYVMRNIQGPHIMLNLLKFKDTADYSAYPGLNPNEKISGYEAYKLYMAAVLPLLQKAGGELVYKGKGGKFLIGPQSEEWDLVLLVRHASVEKFMAFAQDPLYQAIEGHRTAALKDSRLLPMV